MSRNSTRWSQFLLLALVACGHGANARPGAAQRACDHLRRFQAEVVGNAPAPRVQAEIRAAEREAVAAERADPKWVQLLSATKALRVAIDNNDAMAASEGIAIARAQCGLAAPPRIP